MIGWLLMKGAQTAIGAASSKANEKAQRELALATEARISDFISREKSALIVQEPERYSSNQVADAKRILMQQEADASAARERDAVAARVREAAEITADAERKRVEREEILRQEAVQRDEAKARAAQEELKRKADAEELEKARQAKDWAELTLGKSDADPLDLLKARKILTMIEGANE